MMLLMSCAALVLGLHSLPIDGPFPILEMYRVF